MVWGDRDNNESRREGHKGENEKYTPAAATGILTPADQRKGSESRAAAQHPRRREEEKKAEERTSKKEKKTHCID
jgi:hypothetical protein